ncbi:MAG: UDP-N-acetylglucosamine 1-carboxyvinyltransferase [Deltaproteobacteria bacterium]|nr:UDP-N-acetylglucosamine 1-carboxyvinyltransferase [Deltaproteobacteria bacterium]
MSEYIEITGGAPVSGAVAISGAKNAALPMLMASLLSAEPCVFENVPNLEDVNLTLHLLEHLGAQTEFSGSRIRVVVPQLLATEASYSLVKALRASFWVLGPLLARGRAARVALPGGDIIGARPVDMHLAALAQMGADIKVKHGVVFASAVSGLKPADIDLRFPSVGATHQVMMAAALAPGVTRIKGAAREPEVIALADMINRMGGEVIGAGSSNIEIHGKEELGGCEVTLIGDRIEAGTYLLAACASGGSLRADGVKPAHLGKFLDILTAMGVSVECGDNYVSVRRAGALKPVHVTTGPFPEFATDLQAPLMAALCFADGESSIEETVFEGRFGHVSELCRMGADIRVADRLATIFGKPKLTGAVVEAHDIRAGAALVIAAAASEGESQIHDVHHLRRGYQTLESKLRGMGIKVGVKYSDAEDVMFTGC